MKSARVASGDEGVAYDAPIDRCVHDIVYHHHGERLCVGEEIVLQLIAEMGEVLQVITLNEWPRYGSLV